MTYLFGALLALSIFLNVILISMNCRVEAECDSLEDRAEADLDEIYRLTTENEALRQREEQLRLARSAAVSKGNRTRGERFRAKQADAAQ